MTNVSQNSLALSKTTAKLLPNRTRKDHLGFSITLFYLPTRHLHRPKLEEWINTVS